MVFHVGLDAETGKVAAFDTNNKNKTKCFKTGTFFGFKKDVSIFDRIDEMISKLKGELGCACISICYGTSSFRKAIVEYALQKGFTKVKLTDSYSEKYTGLALQTDYEPGNCDVIWICGAFICNVWKRENQKAKFIAKSWNLIDQNLHPECQNPNVIFYDNEFGCPDELQEKFPSCNFVSYDSQDVEKSALIKARIMANDEDVVAWDTHSVLDRDIFIYTMGANNLSKLVMRIIEPQPLPFTKSIIMSKDSFDSVVMNYYFFGLFDLSETFALPNYENINFVLEIDGNGNCSTKFIENKNSVESLLKYENINDTADKLSEMNISSKKLNAYASSFRAPIPYVRELSLQSYRYAIPKKSMISNSAKDVICVDLGTSRCCVAVNRKNGITTVPLDNCGERLLPSYVAYDEETIKCGKIVMDRLRKFSKFTVFDSKRLIGREYNHIEIDPTWPFKVVRTNDNQLCLEVENFKGKWQTSAEQVSAELLKYVKQKSEEFQGIKLQNAVITVPAAFTEVQKEATLQAAKLAGWEKIYLLPEPVAAAFAYFVNRVIPNNSNVLVFDLGGGTMDVCIFKIQQDQIEIISNTGDTKLGGRDFDNVLTNYLKNELNVRYGISKLKDKKYKLESQKIKEDLSAVVSCSLDIEDYDATKEGDIQITNVEFEQMTKHLLNKIRNTISSALFNSRKGANEIAKVLQVGGGSRMPMVKNLLKEMFPNAEHCCEEHPDEVVAIGAAYYACSIFSSSELIPPTPPMRSKSIKY